MTQIRCEVLIVGAGPVGLLLAGELAGAGLAVTVAEQLADPMTESRASQLTARTAELLAERGLGRLLDEAQREPTGHFGGIALDLSGVDSPYAGNWKIPQFRTEAALTERAVRAGAEILRAHSLHRLTQDPHQVVCDLHGPAGPVRVSTGFVVGCDGQDSTVRRLGGFEFPAAGATRQLLRADVIGTAVAPRRFERLPNGVAIAATREGVARVMVHEFDRVVTGRPGPPQFAEVAEVWARVTGDDISAGTATWVDAFDNTCGQVTRYQRGRVLLAGDAAHRAMPVGGQALNVGLQDAVNLGWKLAYQVRGWAVPGLLESYHDERHPVGAATLDAVVAQELLLFGKREVEPARAVLSELLQLPVARDHIADMVSGTGIRYGVDAGSLVGTRLRETGLLPSSGARSTTELLGTGRGLLLDLSAGGRHTTGSPAEGWRWRLTVARAAEPVPGAGDSELLLVRPDGHVAWMDGQGADLSTPLRRWFGAPSASSGAPG